MLQTALMGFAKGFILRLLIALHDLNLILRSARLRASRRMGRGASWFETPACAGSLY